MSAVAASPEVIRHAVAVRGSVQFDLASAISGRTYRIFVFQPAAPPPPEGYPVVLVTDGNMNFPIAATMAAAFSLRGGKSALVVGVGYPSDDPLETMRLRNRDLTSPTPLARIRAAPGSPPPKLADYGGSDLFRRFIMEELRAAIAADWPVNPDDQTLFGHSLGGLFVLDVLFSHPAAFRAYAASSPSIWWNRRALLRREDAFVRSLGAGAAPRLLITVGSREQDVPDPLPPTMTLSQAQDMMRDARMVDNARDLALRMKQVKGGEGYTVRFQAFEEEDHLTVVAAAISRALAFALRP